MFKEKGKEILKTAVAITLIYVMAVLLSLVLCDRFSDLESKEDRSLQNEGIVLAAR